MNPLFFAYQVFETPGGLEVRPNPVLGVSEKNIKYFKQYIGRLMQLVDGSSYAEYITGADDTPIVVGTNIDIPVLGVPTPHTLALKYYHIDGVTVDDVYDNNDLAKKIGAFYGFNNTHPDYNL